MRFSNCWVFLCATLSLAACSGGAVHMNGQNSAPAAAATPISAPPPVAASATLSWQAPTFNTDGTPVSGLTGYHIFYGDSPNSLTQSIAVAGAASVSYEISGLTAGTWYFAVAADAADGTQSALSDVSSKTI